MSEVEKNLQKIAEVARDMPESALRGIFAEILLNDGAKFAEICGHMNSVVKHFNERWTDFLGYAEGGIFD